MILLRTWAGIASHWPARRHEWTLGMGALGMSLAMSVQPNMFDLARHYATLKQWTSEDVCSLLFFVVGAGRLVVLVVNGNLRSFPYTPHLRVASAAVGALLWGLFCYSFLETYWRTSPPGGEMVTSLGPVVAYGIAAAVELANVRTASADVGALSMRRA